MTAYIDAATLTLTALVSDRDVDSAVPQYNVGETTSAVTVGGGTVYVQTTTGTGTVGVQVSPDGVHWYTLLGPSGTAISIAVAVGAPGASKLGRFAHKYVRAKVVTASQPMELTTSWGD